MKVHLPDRSRRGVALVITLILLSVITFMAISFLVLSRGERSSVATVTDQNTARLAADNGFARAQAELLGPMIAYTNEFNYDLVVSTNYTFAPGFQVNAPFRTRLENVNYHYPNGTFLAGNDLNQNLVNLYYSPRPPVFVTTNESFPPDFRFYLDLNRNGRYDTNGILPVISADPGNPFYDTNGLRMPNIISGNTLSNLFVGDPEWIGVLDRPGYPHSSSNRFVSRYAYIVVPTGKTLDLNRIHNYARAFPAGLNTMPAGTGDAFFRNQGVGPWEINLASFLVDLNTNYWPSTVGSFGAPYNYRTNVLNGNTGVAFDDALSLLRYRYGRNVRNLWSVFMFFGPNGISAFNKDFIDGYSHGPLMTGTWWPTALDRDSTMTALPWPGSETPNHFFTTQELFDQNEIYFAGTDPVPTPFPGGLGTFSERLRKAGMGLNPDNTPNDSSYNRYTFYRLLSQLGTDSAPDPQDRMNLNFDNLVQSNRVTGALSATNFFTWRPTDFFYNAANRLLASAGYTFTVTNIPIYPTNWYTPSVHRLLQLAANMYDATTNRVIGSSTNEPGLPTVFQPLFGSAGNDIRIAGYQEVTDANQVVNKLATVRDLVIQTDRDQLRPDDIVYGIPLIIGAKKGFPNFNEFAAETKVKITRKLEFRRPTGGRVNETNQMYVIGVSNCFGLEAWNSYSNTFPHNLRLIAKAEMFAAITNQNGKLLLSRQHDPLAVNIPLTANSWPAFVNPMQSFQPSFVIPYNPDTNSFLFLTNAAWRSTDTLDTDITRFERNSGFPVPTWYFILRSRVRFVLVDTDANRIVDFVNLDSREEPLELSSIMQEGPCETWYVQNGSRGGLWCTNRFNGSSAIEVPTFGVMNQIGISQGSIAIDELEWRRFSATTKDRNAAQDEFRRNLLNPKSTNQFYAPFNPYREVNIHTSWQANDPLVHYTLGDLLVLERTNRYELDTSKFNKLANIRSINERYEPWTMSLPSASASPTRFNLAVKDPLVRRSDDWDFPTNKFPNIGWLGRVHRGTPWQTVYLKATPADTNLWKTWTGNGYFFNNYGQLNTNMVALNGQYADWAITHPAADRVLFDQFTTSLGSIASRGKLSINQTNLAAWSAILAGVAVLTNDLADVDFQNDPYRGPGSGWTIIPPAGTYDSTLPFTNLPAVVQITAGINRTRANLPFTRGVFTHLGDILAVPELSVTSPFLRPTPTQMERGITEAAVERIPQQIMGLLQVDPSPRFVIYSYGQSLSPAPHSIITSGPFFGLCTNYQVTAEVATRAVVRVEGMPKKPKLIIEDYNTLPPD